jgi:hypothetical protein
MKKLTVTSLAVLTLSLAAASGAHAVERLPIERIAPPGATSYNSATPTTKRLRCLTCDRRPPAGRYPPGYTPPAGQKKNDLPLPASTSDYQPPVGRYPPGSVPPAQKADHPPAEEPIEK